MSCALCKGARVSGPDQPDARNTPLGFRATLSMVRCEKPIFAKRRVRVTGWEFCGVVPKFTYAGLTSSPLGLRLEPLGGALAPPQAVRSDKSDVAMSRTACCGERNALRLLWQGGFISFHLDAAVRRSGAGSMDCEKKWRNTADNHGCGTLVPAQHWPSAAGTTDQRSRRNWHYSARFDRSRAGLSGARI